MKKIITLLISIALILTFTGCASESDTQTTDAVAVTQSQEIDVDLTTLSSTMVYSEVYNMMVTPENYIGKIVKMRGQFALYTNEDGTENYYAVVIADATACCQQGLEFVWDAHTYPDDYPQLGQEVEVTGEFQTYQEGEATYSHLIANEVSF